MADNKVQVDLVAENKDLNAKLAEAEARLAAMGQKGGKQAAAGIESVGRAARSLNQVLKIVTLPAVAIGAAVRLAQLLNGMLDPAKHLRNEFKGIADDFSRAVNVASIKLNFGDLVGDEAQLRQQANERVQAITDALNASLANPNRILAGKVGILSGAFDNPTKTRRDAEAAVRQVEKARDDAIANAREARDRAIGREGAGLSAALADTDRERAFIEFEQRKLDIRLKYNTLGNNAIDAATQALLEKTEALYLKSLDKMAEATNRQIRTMLAEMQKAQTEGFSVGALNQPNAGSGAVLQAVGQQLGTLTSLGWGGH